MLRLATALHALRWSVGRLYWRCSAVGLLRLRPLPGAGLPAIQRLLVRMLQHLGMVLRIAGIHILTHVCAKRLLVASSKAQLQVGRRGGCGKG